MKLGILCLFVVVLASACVEIPGFGQGNVKTTELPPDIMVVQNTNTIPTPPVNTGDQLTVSFEIKNQDDTNEISSANIQLFDYGLCSPQESLFTPEGWDQITGTYSYSFNSFAPGQTEFIEWTFKAPTNDQTGSLGTTCPIRFKTSYNFSAVSQINVEVITSDRLKDLQRSGETPTFTPDQTIGRGPIKISFDFGAALPIRASSILPVFITVEDKGEGLLGDIPSRKLMFSVPDTFNVSSCDKFEQVSLVNKTRTYTNKQSIPMIKKKSPQLRCSFTVPNDAQVVVEKTYYLSANMSYTYSLTNEVDVEIKPTLTV
jgi:hypothetical protein